MNRTRAGGVSSPSSLAFNRGYLSAVVDLVAQKDSCVVAFAVLCAAGITTRQKLRAVAAECGLDDEDRDRIYAFVKNDMDNHARKHRRALS